ncbi:hypothetical protein WA026_023527 [Henosepilachna vigintioctopunctata]|uniref:Cytochrome P450 n=1 Tax=Henosepilachna vigintioctopunctata TaxID=420089 RepID=A0AAW1TS94_9CUCU
MRSILSPSFTSSKMKAMFVHISEKANLFAQHFLKMDEEIVKVEFKDAFTRYTTDVIAGAAFGVKVDCLKDRENEFYVMGKKDSDFSSPRGMFVLMAYQIFPSIAKDSSWKQDMEKRVKETEESTDTNSTAEKENLDIHNPQLELSDSDIASQVFIFFLGDYDTVSTAMCFMVYELAANRDVQKKLYEEVIENRKDNNELLYETISFMTYLDMVVSECLRKRPAGAFTDRVVSKPYTIEPEKPEEKSVILDVDQYVIIPILAFHHDPQCFEHPEKFIPERFSPENRKNINPYTYFPFGVGPRNCKGSRFALLEIEAVLFHLLSHFEIVPTQETNIPLQINKSSLNFKSVNGSPLGLKKRVQRQNVS